jgi:glyoxylase-like metal-dependent hydrolase (beta-lactamase superfamily II)
MKIIPLSEGSFTIDKTKILVPFDEEKDDLKNRPVGSLLVEIQPFCIVLERDIILIDAGLGFSKNGELQLHANLKANGIEPEQITKVLMSHLHKDHAGGVSFKDRLGNAHLAFPNAAWFVQRREFDYAMETGYPVYMTEEFDILDSHPNVFWLNDDEGSIDNYINYQVTGAHSPFHQVFWINTTEGIVFFGGDDAPQHNQMMSRFVAKYDYDGKKCMELRNEWWAQGKEENWTFLFYHDTKNAVVKV